MRATATEVGIRSDNPGMVPGMVIGEDRPCPKCGYNVRGLAVGKPCPECGRPIFFGFQAQSDHHLADEPMWFILTQSASLWLLFASAMAAGAMLGSWPVLGGLGAPARVIVAAGWIGAVTLLCLRRPNSRQENARVEQEPTWLRLTAVASQSLWLIAAGLAMTPLPAGVTHLPVWIAAAAGVGLLPTMTLLARVADYVGDHDRGERLNNIVLFVAVCIVLWMLGLRLRIPVPILVLSGTPLLMWIIVGSAMYTLWSFYQLAVTGAWSIQIARREDEIVKNLRERFANERADGVSSADRASFGGPVAAPIGSMMGINPKPKPKRR